MAGDSWKNVWSLYGKTFLESFPNIESGHAEVIEEGDGTRRGLGSLPWGGRVISFERGNGQVTCSNPRCAGGGISVESEVYNMIQKGEAERGYNARCSNYNCCNHFQVKIRLRFKPCS